MKRRLLYILLLTAAIALILGLTMTAKAVPPAGTCPASANGSGHEWQRRSSTEASCTTPGETIWICRNCKTRYKETTPARGHTWSAWYTMREPTCTTSGEEVRQCTYYNCDQRHGGQNQFKQKSVPYRLSDTAGANGEPPGKPPVPYRDRKSAIVPAAAKRIPSPFPRPISGASGR